MPSNLKNLQSNIICTKVEHHLYKSRTSFVQKSNIICTKVEHHLYKSRTSFVQKSNIICTNWGFFRKLSPEMILECELTSKFSSMLWEQSIDQLQCHQT